MHSLPEGQGVATCNSSTGACRSASRLPFPVNIVGPLPTSQGKTYLFTIIDRYTRWPEAILMTDATATSRAEALLSHQSHSLEFHKTSHNYDRGSQVILGLWTALGKLLGAQLHRTTSYHPQSNGIVERFHRQLKASLKARLIEPHWMDKLLLGLRSTPKGPWLCPL